MKYKAFVISVWCVFLFRLGASAQQQMGGYMAYGPEVKYFSNLNFRVYQSKNGYLWFGTVNGVVRFDGKRYKNYFSNYADPNSLTDNNIFDIAADKNEDLWFAGFYHGVTKYNQRTGRFTKYPALSKDNNPYYGIYRIVSDSEGNLWFATRGRGLAKYDFEKDCFDLYFPEPDKCRDGTQQGDNYVVDIEEDSRDKNILWIGTFHGLCAFDKQKKAFTYYPERVQLPGETDIMTIEQDRKGFLWLGAWGDGLKCFDKRKKEFIESKHIVQINKTRTLTVYELTSINDSLMYAACLDDGLYELNVNTGTLTNITPPRNPSDPTALLPDIERISFTPDAGIFIGGNYYFYQQHAAFTRLKANISYPFTQKFGYISSASFVWDEKRQLYWLATADGYGLYILDKEGRKIEPVGYEPSIHKGNEYFHDLVIDAKERVWAINHHNGINAWDEGKKMFRKHSGMIPLPADEVKKIQRMESNKAGDVWIITDSVFIFWDVLKNRTETYPFRWSDEYTGNHAMGSYDLQADPEGNAWLFTEAGMFYCDRRQKTVRHIFKTGAGKTALALPIIGAAAFDRDNNIWLTDGNGIQVYNWKQDSVMVSYNTNSGLPVMAINSIKIDTAGRVWAGSSSGLCFFDPAQKIWRLFNRMDGLQRDYLDGKLFITANNKIIIDQLDKFLIKDINELVVPSKPPVLRITSISINHQEYEDSLLPEFITQLALPHNQNNIDIEFAAMDWLYPSKVIYFYKIDGLPADSGWVSNPDCSIRLIALQPGNYTLRIKAINGNNVWSKEVVLPILITPPFWKTAWFIALCMTAMIALLYGLYRYRTNQLKKMFKVRNSISRDLHDEIGATLSSVNMLSAVALLKAGDKNEATPLLQQIKNSVQQAGESMDDIVWSVNPANDPARDTFARIRKYVTELTDAKGLACCIEIDEPDGTLNLPMELRRDVYMVCKEAVNNALKYSGCTTVNLAIRLKNHSLIMTVADDGIGLDTSVLHNSLRNGIGNMRHRIEKHNGVFEITSAKGKGTTISCEVRL